MDVFYAPGRGHSCTHTSSCAMQTHCSKCNTLVNAHTRVPQSISYTSPPLWGATDRTGEQEGHMFFPRFTTPFLFCFSLLMPLRLKVIFCLPRFLVESWVWISFSLSLSLSLRWLYRGVAPLLSPSRSIKETMRQRGTLSVCHQKRTIPTYLPANYSILLNCPAV